jgi:Flagellar hook-length control protein FliK
VNSGGPATGGLLGPSLVIPREESNRERDGEAAAALWAALTAQLAAAERLPSLPAEPSAKAAPSAWHPSAGDLTPGMAQSGVTAEAAPAPAAPERLVLRVDGGTLGELEVTLERKDGAMNVVIGMENKQLVGSVLPDAHALRSALEAAGISVQSLNVVPASEVGTVLAQRRLNHSGQKPAADNKEAADQHPEADRKRAHKRLTLIG